MRTTGNTFTTITAVALLLSSAMPVAASTVEPGYSHPSRFSHEYEHGKYRVHTKKWNNRKLEEHSWNIDRYIPGSDDERPTYEMPLPTTGSVFEDIGIFANKTYFTHDFEIEEGGLYQVTLTDFEFPRPLKLLGLNLTSATDSFGALTEAGSFTFDADPGKYFVSFYGKARHLGQYGIEVAMVTSPVPVPAAAWLFGSGLIGFAGVLRAGKRPAI